MEPELSPCVHLEKHTNSTNNAPIVIQKKWAFACFSAEPPSQRASDETHFFNTTRADYKKSLGRIFGAATPPGALVKILSRISVGGISMVSVVCLSVCSLSVVVQW